MLLLLNADWQRLAESFINASHFILEIILYALKLRKKKKSHLDNLTVKKKRDMWLICLESLSIFVRG